MHERTKVLFAAGLLAIGLLATTAARGTPNFTVFNVSGTFSDPVSTPLSGSITMDVEEGVVTDLDLDVPGIDPGFYNITSIEANGNDIELVATNGGVAVYQLTLVISPFTPGPPPLGQPFIGFTGGTISTGFVATTSPFAVVFSGLTGSVAAAPEPGTLALLGIAVTAIGFARRFR